MYMMQFNFKRWVYDSSHCCHSHCCIIHKRCLVPRPKYQPITSSFKPTPIITLQRPRPSVPRAHPYTHTPCKTTSEKAMLIDVHYAIATDFKIKHLSKVTHIAYIILPVLATNRAHQVLC